MYLDSSAAVKLVIEEGETGHVRAALVDWRVVSSELLAVELHRTAMRLGAGRDVIIEVLRDIPLLDVASSQLRRARDLASGPGRSLGTLDAIHLACALELEESELLTYDGQQAAAAAQAGLSVVSPGRPPGWWVAS